MGEGGWVGMIEEKGMRRKRRGIKTEGGGGKKKLKFFWNIDGGRGAGH